MSTGRSTAERFGLTFLGTASVAPGAHPGPLLFGTGQAKDDAEHLRDELRSKLAGHRILGIGHSWGGAVLDYGKLIGVLDIPVISLGAPVKLFSNPFQDTRLRTDGDHPGDAIYVARRPDDPVRDENPLAILKALISGQLLNHDYMLAWHVDGIRQRDRRRVGDQRTGDALLREIRRRLSVPVTSLRDSADRPRPRRRSPRARSRRSRACDSSATRSAPRPDSRSRTMTSGVRFTIAARRSLSLVRWSRAASGGVFARDQPREVVLVAGDHVLGAAKDASGPCR